jgi:aspartyl-tRNA(Asn)/glutamyl-tRNA(Gln) amidotransferase subunit C
MIKKEQIKEVSQLARLGVSEIEEDVFQKDLSSVLDYFNSLEKVKTSSVEPSFHPNEIFLNQELIMREDEEKPADAETGEALIAASPVKENNYLKVKAIF